MEITSDLVRNIAESALHHLGEHYGVVLSRPSDGEITPDELMDLWKEARTVQFEDEVHLELTDFIAQAAMLIRHLDGDAPLPSGKAISFGRQLGRIETLFSMSAAEGFRRWESAEKARAGIVGRFSDWPEQYLPLAIQFCAGKSSVSYAALASNARRWNDDLIRAGRGVLPGTDKQIIRGIQSLERRGLLMIPGKTRMDI